MTVVSGLVMIREHMGYVVDWFRELWINDIKGYWIMTTINVSIFEVEPVDKWSEGYAGHYVKIDGVLAYHRPYDGSSHEDIRKEAAGALGELLREKLGYAKEPPEEG